MNEKKEIALKKYLPKKWEEMVQEKTERKYSKSHIRNVVLNRLRQNDTIMKIAIDLALANKAEMELLERKLKKLS